jgi:hypothetical protein
MPAEPCPRLQLKYIGPGLAITDYLLDLTLVPGGRPTGADNAPIFNALPNVAWTGRIRHAFHFETGTGKNMPDMIEPVVDVCLLRDLPASGKLWPIIGKAEQVRPGAVFVYNDAGERREGALAKDGHVDLPAGGGAGNVIALTPLRVSDKGILGFPNDVEGAIIPKGTSYHAEYLMVPPEAMAETRRAIGFDGPLPFSLTLSQGTVEKIELTTYCHADGYGISGTMVGLKAPSSWWNGKRRLPLRCTGVQAGWPVGLWQAASGTIQPFACFEGAALGSLDVGVDSAFYFGNLLIASDDRIALAFASDWGPDTVRVEVHNPTTETISARIRSAAAIQGRKPIDASIVLAPGETQYVQ